ncbi:unnamed protein product [Schistosoma margrebowiei]|uniref:Uncharacterized protein n=1 Tax=Schistosoma margrebowiei TaxID=48269 RepID=A0A183M9N6_9TREM|nr:unnamed protein product [Schistosoma margrebowiei]
MSCKPPCIRHTRYNKHYISFLERQVILVVALIRIKSADLYQRSCLDPDSPRRHGRYC